MLKRNLILLAAIALVAAACSGDDDASEGSGEDDMTEDGTSVQVSQSSLGEILTDDSGATLYLILPDQAGPSVCNDACSAAWPPLIGPVGMGTRTDASFLSTATRQDDTDQATYNGWPLYYYGADSEAGDVNGQGVNDVWFVVSAAGEPIP